MSINTKFQADLAPADDRALRTLKEDLQLRSNTDFLADAVALFRWAVSERRLGHRIIAETLTGESPEANLPRTEIAWTETELASLAKLFRQPTLNLPLRLSSGRCAIEWR